MKKRFTEEQIIDFLKEARAGMPVKELRREHGFNDVSLYTWRAKFSGMEVSESRRMKDLEAENIRLKAACRTGARHECVEGRCQGKALSPQVKREAVVAIRGNVNISEFRACRLVGLSRSVLHDDAKPDQGNETLTARLIELAHERCCFGYRQLPAPGEREGSHAKHKQV